MSVSRAQMHRVIACSSRTTVLVCKASASTLALSSCVIVSNAWHPHLWIRLEYWVMLLFLSWWLPMKQVRWALGVHLSSRNLLSWSRLISVATVPHYFASLAIWEHILCVTPSNIFIFLFSGNSKDKGTYFSVFWKVLQSPTWVMEKTKISISYVRT